MIAVECGASLVQPRQREKERANDAKPIGRAIQSFRCLSSDTQQKADTQQWKRTVKTQHLACNRRQQYRSNRHQQKTYCIPFLATKHFTDDTLRCLCVLYAKCPCAMHAFILASHPQLHISYIYYTHAHTHASQKVHPVSARKGY